MTDGVAVVENHEKRIGKLEVKTGQIDVKLGNHEKDINDLKKNMDSVYEKLSKIEVKISELGQSIKWNIRYAVTISTLFGMVAGGLIVWAVEHL